MKLAARFYRLPLHFDVQRLQAEVAQFAEDEWQKHPSGYNGNSAVRLITADGGENDDTSGAMLTTPHLQRCPYISQILASFGVVWGRSRLMRLAPGAIVPEHSDVNYQWFHRVRVHIPVVTHPGVSFRCADQTVHMAAGEAWLFDNWHLHEVRNDSPVTRVHLVADTIGTSEFWRRVAASQSSNFETRSGPEPLLLPYEPGRQAALLTERHNLSAVMPPSEVEQLAGDMIGELVAIDPAQDPALLASYIELVRGFCQDWRSLWSLHADGQEGWPHYVRLRDQLDRDTERFPPAAIICASNNVPARRVLRDRIVDQVFKPAAARAGRDVEFHPRAPAAAVVATGGFERPVFIVAAPRSGSTLLFETLARAPNLYTLGGEGHGLVEDLPQLRPGAVGVETNRITGEQVDEAVRAHVVGMLRGNLRDRDGKPLPPGVARFLEKTPKNALRIPFFNALFPDARFIFLWRDPRENISSIMEAWRSGGWRTYLRLPGWDGPWSMLLPPGYRELRGKPLEEIAAYQWARTNHTVLEDLSRLPAERWTSLSYAEFMSDPAATTRRLCAFAGLEFDPVLAAHCARPLPLSAHTLTPPRADKWRANEEAVLRVLPDLQAMLRRLQGLDPTRAAA